MVMLLRQASTDDIKLILKAKVAQKNNCIPGKGIPKNV